MISKNVLVALSLSPVIMVTAVQGVPMKAEVTTGGAPIELRAAGSLKAAMSDIIAAYQAQSQMSVVAQYAPSGLLLKRIQEGEKVDIFGDELLNSHPVAFVAKLTSVPSINRLVLHLDLWRLVDGVDGNGLDNERANLQTRKRRNRNQRFVKHFYLDY